jgi:hypothetical protein
MTPPTAGAVRRPGDTQSILVVALTLAATAVAFYDLMLLALAMR